MKRQSFEEQRQLDWATFEATVDQLEGKHAPQEPEAFPKRFRQLCSDLSLAQHRMYGLKLCDRLNRLVIRGHRHLYRGGAHLREALLHFILRGFPQAFRADLKLFGIANAFFWIPLLTLLAGSLADPHWGHSVLGTEMMANLESMYGDGDPISHLRQEHGSNFMMFAFYVMNNIGIDFRIFAGGILFGVGTLFFVLFNGLFFGAATAYIHEVGNPESYYTFISGHVALELLGMLVAAMAGMRLGFALLDPGRHTRKQALLHGAKRAVPLLYGAALLTFLAALVEGFWSARPFPSMTKYAVGVSWFILLTLYLTLSGRERMADET